VWTEIERWFRGASDSLQPLFRPSRSRRRGPVACDHAVSNVDSRNIASESGERNMSSHTRRSKLRHALAGGKT
jgi:hypothetical protein